MNQISPKQADVINETFIQNMGMIGTTIRPAKNIKDEIQQAERINTEQQVLTGLLVTMVQYLSRIDSSFKTQIKTQRWLYADNQRQQREMFVESGSITPDAIPVAANDNQPAAAESETTSSLAGTTMALVVGGIAAIYGAYKLFMNSVEGVLSPFTDMEPVNQDAKLAPPEPAPLKPPGGLTPVKQTPPRKPQTKTAPTKGGPVSRPTNTQQSSGASSAPPPAVPNPTPTPNTTPVPPPVASPQTKPPVSTGPAATAPAATAPTAVKGGEIPKNDIVALGNYLAAQGAQKHKMEHPSLSGTVGEHSKNSRHYRGMAIDVNFPGPNEGAILDKLEPQLQAAGYHTLWRKPGHQTHMHVSVGGAEGAGSYGAGSLVGATVELIDSSIEAVQTKLHAMMEKVAPTNLMTKKLGAQAIERDKDLTRPPISVPAGNPQGAASKVVMPKPPKIQEVSQAGVAEAALAEFAFMFDIGDQYKSPTVKGLTTA